jgi:hypothetical protein
MWRDFKTTLQGTFAEDLHRISKDQHNCFHEIRALTVGGRHVGPEYQVRYSGFMEFLRDDQLLEFSSPKETPLTSKQLLDLLCHQSNLRTFRARLDVSDTAIEDMASWTTENTSLVTSAFRALKILRIYVGDRSIENEHNRAVQDHEMACSGLLVSAAPLLDSLEICGWRPIWNYRVNRIPLTHVFESAPNLCQISRTLRHLLLVDMNLSGVETRIIDAIDLAALCSIKLECCDKVVSFLRTLTISFRRDGAQLKALTVRTRRDQEPRDDEMLDVAVRDLLSTFAGLEALELDFMFCGFMDNCWKASLGAHLTLKKLLVSSYLMTDGGTGLAENITDILKHCPQVQHFAYRPTPFRPESIADCPLPCSLPFGLSPSLDALAAVPFIRTLRLIYAPGLKEERSKFLRGDKAWAEKAGQIAHRFASLVLRRLYMKGSKIKLLALSPESRWEQLCADKNLHHYPHYFYRLRIVYLHGEEVVEAVPIRDYVAECPEAAVFV